MRSFLLLLPAALLVGCTSTRTLAPGELTGTLANADLADQAVRLALADGRVVPARSVAVYADSTSWVDPATGALVHVPTADVRSVSRRVRGRAAWQGALVSGLVSSAVLGVVIASDLSKSDWGDGYNDVKPLFGMALGAMAFVPGAAVGGGVGYLAGAEDRYEVRPAAPAASSEASEGGR